MDPDGFSALLSLKPLQLKSNPNHPINQLKGLNLISHDAHRQLGIQIQLICLDFELSNLSEFSSYQTLSVCRSANAYLGPIMYTEQ